MNIFELAQEREKQMEAFYKDMAKNSQHKGLKKILTLLAEEESTHITDIKQIQQQVKNMPVSNFVIDAKNILLDMKKQKAVFEDNIDQLELYRKAREHEEESEKLYLAEAQKTKDAELRVIFLKLAEQEKRHYDVIDEIIAFIEKPEQWISSPEFSSLDQY